MKISSLKAFEILDSRGWPTVRVQLITSKGNVVYASVPSGASTGSHEALELRDQDVSRYLGKGVSQAITNINNLIASKLIHSDFAHPKTIDEFLLDLDGTSNKTKLGANAILAVSLASMRAFASDEDAPLWEAINSYYFSDTGVAFPRLMINLINGGAHANWMFDFQEYMVIPKSNLPSQALQVASTIFHTLEKDLLSAGLSTYKGDEGGYSPKLADNESPLMSILSAAEKAGYKNGEDFQFGLDTAASEYFEDGNYQLKKNGLVLSGEKLSEFYLDLVKKYQILTHEDPFAEDDWASWKDYTSKTSPLGLTVIGDDLLVTNTERIKIAIEKKACNAVLIKVNQIGTLAETVEAINISRKYGWQIAISHRSGETEDTFIADLAFGCGADFLKSGSVSRSERLAKYNRLLEIENLDKSS